MVDTFGVPNLSSYQTIQRISEITKEFITVPSLQYICTNAQIHDFTDVAYCAHIYIDL